MLSKTQQAYRQAGDTKAANAIYSRPEYQQVLAARKQFMSDNPEFATKYQAQYTNYAERSGLTANLLQSQGQGQSKPTGSTGYAPRSTGSTTGYTSPARSTGTSSYNSRPTSSSSQAYRPAAKTSTPTKSYNNPANNSTTTTVKSKPGADALTRAMAQLGFNNPANIKQRPTTTTTTQGQDGQPQPSSNSNPNNPPPAAPTNPSPGTGSKGKSKGSYTSSSKSRASTKIYLPKPRKYSTGYNYCKISNLFPQIRR